MVGNGSIYNTVTADPATLALAPLAGAFTTPGTTLFNARPAFPSDPTIAGSPNGEGFSVTCGIA